MSSIPILYKMIIFIDSLHFLWRLIFSFLFFLFGNTNSNFESIFIGSILIIVFIQFIFAMRSLDIEFTIKNYNLHKQYMKSKLICWSFLCLKIGLYITYSPTEFIGDVLWAIFEISSLLFLDNILEKLTQKIYDYVGPPENTQEVEIDLSRFFIKDSITLEVMGSSIIKKGEKITLGKVIHLGFNFELWEYCSRMIRKYVKEEKPIICDLII